MGVDGRRGPAAPTGRGCRALGDQVEARSRPRSRDEAARHAGLTSYSYTLDTRSFVDGPENCNKPRGAP